MKQKKLSFDLNDVQKWQEISWIKYEIGNSIYALRKLIVLQNKGFESLNQDLNNEISNIKSQNEQMDEQDLDQYVNHLYGIDQQIIIDLKRIQNFSKVISIFAVLESKSKVICDKLQTEFKPNFELGKTNSVFLRHWKFLRCFLDFKVSTIEKYFTPIINQMEVRNIINHQDGIATNKQYKELSNVKGLKFQEFDNAFYLVNIDDIFNENLLNQTEYFFDELLNAIKLKTNE